MALGLSRRLNLPSIIHLGNYRNLYLPIDFTKEPKKMGMLKTISAHKKVEGGTMSIDIINEQ